MIPACPRWRSSTSGIWRLERRPREHPVDQVRPIERPDELDRVAQAELRGDVAAHPRGRRRGVGVQADTAASDSRSRAELPVLGPEIVPPLADAVRLVDRDEADRRTASSVEETVAALAHQPLRRDVEQPVPPLAHAAR